MKYSIILLACFIAVKLKAQENYSIQIGDKNYSIAMDSIYEINFQGKKLSLLLKQKDTLQFADSVFSFSYLKGYQVSQTTIENAAIQYMLMDAGGSGYFIQKYWTMNPSMIKEVLLQELTKESKGYGYIEKKEEYQRTLNSGQTITVLKSTLTYKDETNVYEIAAFGSKDEGLVIVTMDMGKDFGKKGRILSDLMWHSIRYNNSISTQ